MRNDLENEAAAATLPVRSRLEALTSYANSLDAGASHDVSLSVALAKLRACSPTSTEWQLRAWLAQAFAAD